MRTSQPFLDKWSASLARTLLDALKTDKSGLEYQRTAQNALKYYLAPIDVIPDLLPGIGHLDDCLVLFWAVKRCGLPVEKSEDPYNIFAIKAEIRAHFQGENHA